MALLAARCYLMAAIWLCATVAVSAELCKDHLPECSFYTQDCDFMGRLCPRTCGYCLVNSGTHHPFSRNEVDSEGDEIPEADPGSPPESRHIGRTDRVIPGTDHTLPAEGRHMGRTARAHPETDPTSPVEGSQIEMAARALPRTDLESPAKGIRIRPSRALAGTDLVSSAEGSLIGRTARALPGSGWNPSLLSLGGYSSAAKEVQSIVADAFSHFINVSDADSLRVVCTEQYKPLSYLDVTNNNNRRGGEFSTSPSDEEEYNFVYEEGDGNYDVRGTLKNDPVDFKLLDIDYLRKAGLLEEEIQRKYKNSQYSVTTEERKIVELFLDQYNSLEESARVFNISEPLAESADKFIKFYEAGSSLAYTEFLYRLFTSNPLTERYDDYFIESEEQVASFIDAIVTFDFSNLKRSI